MRQRLALSGEISLQAPDKYAMALTTFIPYYDATAKRMAASSYHIGLLGVQLIGGLNAEKYSVGARGELHFGIDKKLSLLKLAIQSLKEQPLVDEAVVQRGQLYTLALTFVQNF